MLEQIYYIDKTIIFYIHTNFHSQLVNNIMILFTNLGNNSLIWITVAIILMYNKKTRYVGIITIIALLISTLLGEGILKNIIQRSRPSTDFSEINLLIHRLTSYSLPSGHTTTSFAAAYVLSRYLKKYSLIFWIIAGMIGFSRIYLFMHYPTDVLAGIILGVICGKIASIIYEKKINHQILS
ncbi:MAG: phosphatase PAP2 family protein [Firmicutes bacterium]|nr:phosphatase PAP2 family protein [Bacillota bacterium]